MKNKGSSRDAPKMGVKTYQNTSLKLVCQELEVQKLEVPKLIVIVGQGDLAILFGEGEGSLPLHHPVALIHYLIHKLLSI